MDIKKLKQLVIKYDGEWQGTVSELTNVLQLDTKANKFSSILKRNEKRLADAGIKIAFMRCHSGRSVSLKMDHVEEPVSMTVADFNDVSIADDDPGRVDVPDNVDAELRARARRHVVKLWKRSLLSWSALPGMIVGIMRYETPELPQEDVVRAVQLACEEEIK